MYQKVLVILKANSNSNIFGQNNLFFHFKLVYVYPGESSIYINSCRDKEVGKNLSSK